jgi:hypothetical protein
LHHLPPETAAATTLTACGAFVCITSVKFVFACLTLLVCAACNTLENRRDLYSHDRPLFYERPAATTTVQQTTTTTTEPIEFRPRPNSEETPELPGE